MTVKKILITGGTGFIGSELVKKLVSLDYHPHLFIQKSSSFERLQSVLGQITFSTVDLANTPAVSQLIDKVKPEVIYHLAGYGVYSYTDNSELNNQRLVEANILGSISLLQAASKEKFRLFVHTGSCFEYGSRSAAFSEEDSLRPVNFYGVSKAFATLYAQSFSKKHYLPVVCFRPFTVYGPGQDEKRFITATMRKCLKGENPQLTRKVITRDYLYVDDLIEAYLLAMSAKPAILQGEIINIATGRGFSTREVAIAISKICGRPDLQNEVGAFPERPGEVFSLVGRPEKAAQLLKWRPTHSLEAGLTKVLKSLL